MTKVLGQRVPAVREGSLVAFAVAVCVTLSERDPIRGAGARMMDDLRQFQTSPGSAYIIERVLAG